MARDNWHELAGWLTFGAAIAVLLLFQRLMPRVRPPFAAPTRSSSSPEWAAS